MGYKAPRNDKGEIDYGVGLDLGNGSVGWVAMDKDYHLIRARGHELIGARLFDPANSAEKRRTFRTTRRRLSRRRWRLRMLDSLFASELAKVDPNFLARRKYSWVHPKDNQNHENWYGSIIFGSKGQDKQFYKEYPTIYHLRKKLMEDTERHDIREIYVAIHHIVKYRGHFLREGEINSENLFDPEGFIELIKDIIKLNNSYDESTPIFEASAVDISEALLNERKSRSGRIEDTLDKLDFSVSRVDKHELKGMEDAAEAVIGATVGNTADFSKIFNLGELDKDSKSSLKLKFADSNFDEKYESMVGSGLLNETQIELVDRIHAVYDAVALKGILGDAHTISEAKVESYEKHRKNWKLIKEELRTKEDKDEVDLWYGNLSGRQYKNSPDPEKGPNEGSKKDSPIRDSNQKQNLIKKANEYFTKLIDASQLSEEQKNSLKNDINNGQLFPVQRSSNNGVIPYQIHLNELRRIIENQKQYYPFLAETFIRKTADGKSYEENKIVALLKFRVPYYVGPLVSKEDMEEHSSGNSAYHWMARNPGRDEAITPWNFDEVVDKDESGARFISRLTGTDTYLLGEPTLPQHSLLYEEYMVLSELNNVRLNVRQGNHWSDKNRQRLSYKQKEFLIENLFKEHKTVTRKRAEDCLSSMGCGEVQLFGLSDEKKFASSLSSYITLKKILGKAFVDDPGNSAILERIIEVQTVFEDREPLAHQLSLIDSLTVEQRKQLAKIHYTGWGKLSRKLLTSKKGSYKIHSQNEIMRTQHSIIDIMRGDSLNLIEIIRDKKIGIGEWIDNENLDRETGESDVSRLESVFEGIVMSPRVKRGVVQAVRVIDDLAKAIGNPPQRIFIEMADEVQASQRTVSRLSRLKALYGSPSLQKEFNDLKDLRKSLNETKDADLQEDRLYLYYIQLGKDLYTGKEISIDSLSSAYDIDHIVPQALTQDDSIDNRVLVSRKENARKTDSYLYTPDLIKNMRPLWGKLLAAGLMSQKKYDALTRVDDFKDREKQRFVQRSLVETRQIMKNVSTILRTYYGEDTNVVTLKSSITHDMRKYLGFPYKNRDINDYHHAQDALCISAAGQFMLNRHFVSGGEVTDGASNAYNMYLAEYLQEFRDAKARGERKRSTAFGFVVGSMSSKDDEKRTDHRTGEIVWSESNAEYLRKVMNYKKMLITQKVGDVKTCALYDETRYGHKESSAKSIKFDNLRRDTSLYGGFSGASTAYMMLVEYKKKNKLVSITAQEASLLAVAGPDNKSIVMKAILAKHGFENVTILLPYIVVGQLVQYSSALVTIQSAGEFNTARQLWLPQHDYNDADIILKAKSIKDASYKLGHDGDDQYVLSRIQDLFKSLFEILEKSFPLHVITGAQKEKVKKALNSHDFIFGQKNLQLMFESVHANAAYRNLRDIGLSPNWRRINNPTGFTLSDSDTFIYQSPSGIFEQRVTVKELKEKADKRK